MKTILELKNITASYGDEEVLQNVSFAIEEGEILGLVGESGSGKSTSARVAAGLLAPVQGEVLLSGMVLAERRSKEEHRKIQMVFQNPEASLNPRRKVGQILMDALAYHGISTGAEAKEKCMELVKRMELPEDTLTRYPRTFSGGQKQRIALMRALCVEPEVLIADEPTSALDVSVQLKMLELLETVQKERHFGVLFISHDLGVIHHLCDRVAVMKEGKIVEMRRAADFFKAPATDYGKQLLNAVPRIDI